MIETGATSGAATPAEGWPTVTRGVMRPRLAKLKLDRPLPDGWRGALKATVHDGATREVLLALGTAEDPRRLSVALPAVTDPGAPLLLAVTPVAIGPDGAEAELATEPGFQLGTLLPLGEVAIKRLVFRKEHRPTDVHTLEFVMDQIMRSPLNGPLEKIEAAKIASYRAMEQADAARLALCVGHVDAALAQSAELAKEVGIGKNNRFHARMSLWFVRAYLLLFLEDIEGCEAMLEQLRANVGGVERCPTAANNTALGLTVLGYLRLCQGDAAGARRAWDDVIALFRTAAQHYPAKAPELFQELVVSFEAARFCAFAGKAVRTGRFDIHRDLNSATVARTFLRLRGSGAGAGIQRAEDIFEALKQRPREPEVAAATLEPTA